MTDRQGYHQRLASNVNKLTKMSKSPFTFASPIPSLNRLKPSRALARASFLLTENIPTDLLPNTYDGWVMAAMDEVNQEVQGQNRLIATNAVNCCC